MANFLFLFIGGSLLLLATNSSSAALQYRSGAEILPQGDQAYGIEFQTFSKTLSYDEVGTELILGSGDSFNVNDINLLYSNSFSQKIEGTFVGKFRQVSLETNGIKSTNSGIESLDAQAKYLFHNRKSFKNALGLHLKKSLYSNSLYVTPNTPPSDLVALGDDGLEWGVNYFTTYMDRFFKYDFKLGFNKPSSTLSSEMIYNAELIYNFNKLAFYSGIGGIHSFKNDPYTNSPISKPVISSGNDRLFNSINREKEFLYAGASITLGNFLIGIRGETIASGRSTDKGQTISLNLRWEKPQPVSKMLPPENGLVQEYSADGFVEEVSTSKQLLKINIGSNRNIKIGDNVDIFNVDAYTSSPPIAHGEVIKVGANSSVVKINRRFKNSPISSGNLVRVY